MRQRAGMKNNRVQLQSEITNLSTHLSHHLLPLARASRSPFPGRRRDPLVRENYRGRALKNVDGIRR